MSSYQRLPDGTVWPTPDDRADEYESVEWRLRYTDDRNVRFVAASYVAAYTALLRMPRRRREQIIAELRRSEAIALRQEAS